MAAANRASRAKRWAYRTQAAAAYGFYGVFRPLPVPVAARLGAGVGRCLGPLLRGQTRRADKHLALAFPEQTRTWRRAVRQGMWANLGALVGEYAHLDHCLNAARQTAHGDGGPARGARVEIVGGAQMQEAYRQGRPPLGALGHFGNWEIASAAMSALGLPGYVFYREFNNPYTNKLMNRLIAPLGIGRLSTGDGKTSGRRGLALLRQGHPLGFIVDQHIDGGIVAPFFGYPAATSPAAADMARHLGLSIYPIRVERLGPAHFRVTCEAPIPVARTRDRLADVTPAVQQINAALERWVRERPSQWLWLHRRWKASVTPRRPKPQDDA